MASPNKYSVKELLKPTPDTQYSDPKMNAIAKGYRLAGRATWEAFTKSQEAMHDPLTGLLRKEYWKADLDDRMQAGVAFGIAFMDLDYFKLVNDKLGHERGDKLLNAFGDFLEDKFKRKSDVFGHERIIQSSDAPNEPDEQPVSGRYGGDEFTATFDLHENSRRNNLSPQESMVDEIDYMRGVTAEFVDMQPQDIKDLGFNISTGFAVWDPEHPTSRETLLAEADESMYAAKALQKQPA